MAFVDEHWHPNVWPAKLGTQPAVLRVDGRSKVVVGKQIRVKKIGHCMPWFRVTVDRIGPGRHLFVSL